MHQSQQTCIPRVKANPNLHGLIVCHKLNFNQLAYLGRNGFSRPAVDCIESDLFLELHKLVPLALDGGLLVPTAVLEVLNLQLEGVPLLGVLVTQLLQVRCVTQTFKYSMMTSYHAMHYWPFVSGTTSGFPSQRTVMCRPLMFLCC